jgi:hypothetical protein
MSSLRPAPGTATPALAANPETPHAEASGLGMGKQWSGRLGKSQASGGHAQNPRRAALENNDSKLSFQALNSLRQG